MVSSGSHQLSRTQFADVCSCQFLGTPLLNNALEVRDGLIVRRTPQRRVHYSLEPSKTTDVEDQGGNISLPSLAFSGSSLPLRDRSMMKTDE